MNRIHFKSDFKLRLAFSDADGEPIPMNDLDFDFWFFTKSGSQSYLVARQGSACRRCRILEDGSVLALFDAHSLQPGQLLCDFTIHACDSDLPDASNEINVAPVIPLELVETRCNSHGLHPSVPDTMQPILVNISIPLHRPMLQHHVTRKELMDAINAHIIDVTASDDAFAPLLTIFDNPLTINQ